MIETVHVAVVPLKAIPGLMIILRGVAAALALSGTTTSKIAISNAIFYHIGIPFSNTMHRRRRQIELWNGQQCSIE